jgi:replication-associated recombination protein RarA
MDDLDNMDDFDQMMDEVNKWNNENNKYLIRHVNTHNLLLMGKTTVAKVLENPCSTPSSAKLHSETKQSNFNNNDSSKEYYLFS